MSNDKLNELTATLKEWEALYEESKAMVESIKDDIKAELAARDTEECVTDKYIIRWTNITSNRLDTTALKTDFPELYKKYTKQVASRKFTVSA